MLLSLKNLYIQDASGTPNAVSLSAINEGVDGSAVFGISSEKSELQIESGMTYIDRANPSMDVRVLKPSASEVTQLKSWSDNQTDVYISGITPDGFVYFGDGGTLTGACKIVANEQLTDNDVFAFKVTLASGVGFDPSTGLYEGGFWVGKNGLGNYEWGDASGNNTPNGWTITNFTGASFSAGALSVDDDDSGSENTVSREVYLGFPNETLTFSANFTAIPATAQYSTNIRIKQSQSDGTLISTTDAAVNTTGVRSVSATLASNCAIVELAVVNQLDNIASTNTLTFADPMLSLTGSTSYTKF